MKILWDLVTICVETQVSGYYVVVQPFFILQRALVMYVAGYLCLVRLVLGGMGNS